MNTIAQTGAAPAIVGGSAFTWKPWVMALRPKTLTAALVPIIVATALVSAEGYVVQWWISLFALLSSVFIQIGTNLVNDAIDFHKGADTETRIGPQRVTQSGLLSSRQVMFGGFLCFVVALAFGIPLVIAGGWPIVAIGVVSLFLGYAYTGGPFPLAYVGLGDLFVVLFFGVIAVGGTFYLHTHLVTISALMSGLQVGFLAAVLIAVNNLRDAPEDAKVGKKTVAVRFGVDFARGEIAILALVPFAFGAYWLQKELVLAAALPLLAMPLARRVITGVFRNPPSAVYNRFLATAAGLHLVFGVMLAIALLLKK